MTLVLYLTSVNIFHFCIIIMAIHEKTDKILANFDGRAGAACPGAAPVAPPEARGRGARWTADDVPRIVPSKRANMAGAGAP